MRYEIHLFIYKYGVHFTLNLFFYYSQNQIHYILLMFAHCVCIFFKLAIYSFGIKQILFIFQFNE